MIYFEDKDQVGPYKITVSPKRTKHLRFNDLKDPEEIPRGTDYASALVSDVPIISILDYIIYKFYAAQNE